MCTNDCNKNVLTLKLRISSVDVLLEDEGNHELMIRWYSIYAVIVN